MTRKKRHFCDHAVLQNQELLGAKLLGSTRNTGSYSKAKSRVLQSKRLSHKWCHAAFRHLNSGSLYVGARRLSFNRIIAERIMASADRVLFSRSTDNRRHRISQPNVRSTVHQIGNRTKPFAPLGGRTISRSCQPFSATQSFRSWLWNLLSANTTPTLDTGCSSNCWSTSGATAPNGRSGRRW
jgi:hypothetical protein